MNDSFENIHFGDKFSFKRNMDKNFMKKKTRIECSEKRATTVYKVVVKIHNKLKCQSVITISISWGFSDYWL